MTEYLVLRDLSRPVTKGPFEPPGGGFGVRAGALEEVPAEPVIQAEQLSKSDVLDLGRDPQVHAIAPAMPIQLVEPAEVAEADAATTAWGITAVGADVSGRDGTGVTVAVLDTGIDAGHKAFVGVNLTEQDFTGSGNGDVKGHGSHCAGTIFGRDVEGTRIGVARGVENALIGKVLGNDGRGDSTMLFKGIQWAIENGAQVISMSLGFDFPGLAKRLVAEQQVPVDLATSIALEGYRANLRMFDALMALVRTREAFGVGTVVVAAAGNESHREIDPKFEVGVSVPAAAEGVVSVGALLQTAAGLAVAPFSNTFPQVAAPGVNVLSVKLGGGLKALSGTSMATPHVAGVTALWWQEVQNSPLPPSVAVVTSRLLARARTDGFAPGVDVADRGAGLVTAP